MSDEEDHEQLKNEDVKTLAGLMGIPEVEVLNMGPGGDNDGDDDDARLMMVPSHRRFDSDDDDLTDCDDDDETIGERLLGLTEMLPSSLRNVTSGLIQGTWNSSKWLLSVGRTGLWVAASSATILALPVMFESERMQIEEQQLSQQRQLMLGPNAAMAGAGHGMVHGGSFPSPGS